MLSFVELLLNGLILRLNIVENLILASVAGPDPVGFETFNKIRNMASMRILI